MRIALKPLGIICVLVTMLACAERESLDYGIAQQAALDAWIEKNVPAAQLLGEGLGIYYEIVEQAPVADAATPEPGDWVKVEYEVRDLDGNIVYTRSRNIAERVGSFTKYTYYVPDFFIISSSVESTSIMKAQYYALLKMKEGEVWRLYAPSTQLYNTSGLTNSIGYGGQYSLKGGRPAIIDNFTIKQIVKNPDLMEQEQVEQIAFEPAPIGWDLQETDTLTRHFYRQFLRRGPLKDTVRADSTARFYYIGKFIDGFVMDTNIDSVWMGRFGGKRHDNSSSTPVLVDDTTALSIQKKYPNQVSSSMPDKVFSLLYGEEREDMKLRYGDSVRIVITSPYAYGEKGRVGYKTSSSASSDYYYNPGYYMAGGYGYYGSSYYNSYNSAYYNYYNVAASTKTFPRAEVKEFTPLIYEFVVKRPVGKTGLVEEENP